MNVLDTIQVTSGPGGLAYDSGKNEVFVVNGNDVSVVSDGTNQVVATVTLPTQSDPYALAYDSSKNEIFAADYYSGAVSIISDGTNQVVATVTLPKLSEPSAIVYDSGAGYVFVTCPGTSTAPGTVAVISDKTNAIIATVPVGTGPNTLAYDSAKDEVFVSNSIDNTVSVILDAH